MSSFKKIKKASKYADCKNSGKGSLLKYYGVKTERRGNYKARSARFPSDAVFCAQKRRARDFSLAYEKEKSLSI